MTSHPYFHDRMPLWAELDELLDRPEFDQTIGGVNVTYRRLQSFGRLLGPARELWHAPARLLAAMEWAGTVDPALMHSAMVHYCVAAGTLVECGRPCDDLDSLGAGLDAMDAPGVIVATELGRGGSQVGIRTVARYDRARRTFTLDTPDDSALKIMPNVGWTGLCRTAVVIARLLVDGTDHGVHPFGFRFPHPRAQVAAIPRGAPVPLDYSVIRFAGAEIPFGYWLSDTAVLTAEGVDDPLSPPRRLARSLNGVTAAVTAAAVALAAAARATVAIAARYNTQRLVGLPGTPALRFPAHSGGLASAIARVYAVTSYVEKVRRDFVADRAGSGQSRAVETADHAPWLAADLDRVLAKAAATTALEAVAATCRRLCGFQGVLHVNRITDYEDMARSFHAAGGDTRLLLLEAGKQLLNSTDTPTAPGGFRVDDPAAVTRMLSVQECVLGDRTRQRVDRDGPDDHLRDIEQLGRVHVLRRMLQEFDDAVSNAPQDWRPMLAAARGLYGVEVLLESADWYLNHGSLRPGDVDVLHHAHATATERVLCHLDPLVAGLAVPPGRVGGFIGRADYIDRVAALVRPVT